MPRIFLLFLLLLLALSVTATAQTSKDVAAPESGTSRLDLEKWIIRALTKYGKYKTATTSVSISAAKFTGCVLNFDYIRRPSSIEIASDRTVFKTQRVTQPVSIDAARIAAKGITIGDYLDPDLRTLTMSYDDVAKTEIIVQHEAAAAMRKAFEMMQVVCTAKP